MSEKQGDKKKKKHKRPVVHGATGGTTPADHRFTSQSMKTSLQNTRIDKE